MNETGYEIQQGKYLAFQVSNQKYFTNVKILGTHYAEDSILRRLEKKYHKVRIPQNAIIQSKDVQKILQKHCEVYPACRDVVRAEKGTLYKSLYRKQHLAEYHFKRTCLCQKRKAGPPKTQEDILS